MLSLYCSSFLSPEQRLRDQLFCGASGFLERGYGAGAPFSCWEVDPGQATLIAAELIS